MEERWGAACKGGLRFDFVVAEQNFSIQDGFIKCKGIPGRMGAWARVSESFSLRIPLLYCDKGGIGGFSFGLADLDRIRILLE